MSRFEAGCRMRRPAALLALVTLLTAGTAGPYDITLLSTPQAPTARGHARLIFAPSPFGVALTQDGHAVYDMQITVSGLPRPSSLGAFTSYVAWVVSPDLTGWHRLGPVANGTTTVGHADLNKFLLVITAEADTTGASSRGPTVLHGTSPSGWLQSFLTHPLFRGISQ